MQFVVSDVARHAFGFANSNHAASANHGDSSESFAWDGLALIQRGDEQFINEPHVGGGNHVASSKGTSYFNDMLGTTVGAKKDGKYSAVVLTAFGEGTDADKAFFTGKPFVEGLCHAFLMRNYRAGLAKWQTADPMGYPDGWNQLAYCGNGVAMRVDMYGAKWKVMKMEYIGRWKYDSQFSVGFPLLDVYKYMKDIWDLGRDTMKVLKIKSLKDLAKAIKEDLSDDAKEKLKKLFDDGFWFDELMKNVPDCGYYCDPPTEADIEKLAEKQGVTEYEVVSVVLDSLDPDINDSIPGAWFILGCDQKWKITIKHE